MIRIVLSLLAALPMLMPPGICLCQAAPRNADQLQKQSVAAKVAPPAPSQCCCTRHRKRTEATQYLASNLPAGRKSIQPDSTPSQQNEQHSPGCPAASDATSSKFVQRTVSHFLVVTSYDLLAIEPCFVAAAFQEPAPRDSSSSCPLYLINCSILI